MYGGVSRLAVGKPSARPRRWPRTTTPSTRCGRPRSAAAAATSPAARCSLISEDEIVTAPSASSGTPSAVNSYFSPSSPSSATLPAARCPNRKFSPTTTAAAPSRSTSTARTNSSGPSLENSSVNGNSQTALTPSSPSSSARRRGVHSRGGWDPGLMTSSGCGSKVTTATGSPSSAATSVARPTMR